MANNDFDVNPQQEKNPLKGKPESSLELLSTVIEAGITDCSHLDSAPMKPEVLLEGFASLLPRYIEQLEKDIVSCNKEIEKIEEQREHFEKTRKRLSLVYEIIKESENQ